VLPPLKENEREGGVFQGNVKALAMPRNGAEPGTCVQKASTTLFGPYMRVVPESMMAMTVDAMTWPLENAWPPPICQTPVLPAIGVYSWSIVE
jgi:hypothetical protein